MTVTNMYQGALIAREAHLAMLNLKSLVDNAVETIRSAELDSIGLAVNSRKVGDPLRTLRNAAESLRSAKFETALSLARARTDAAVAWLQIGDDDWDPLA
jgi:hypothetical protein